MNRHPGMMRLLALVKANQQVPIRTYQTTRNEAGEPTIFLYDVIDPYFGISAEKFVKDLMAIDASRIHLRINSPGGDVFEAQAMITAIEQHPATIVSHIDGLAASAASQIAIASEEVEIAEGGFYMIHRSWTFAFGNAEDLMDIAELLEKVDDEMVKHYIRETKNTEEQIRAWVNAETWFNAEEAIEHGFADRKAEKKAAENRWNLSAYAHVPKALLESAAPTPTPITVRPEDVASVERGGGGVNWKDKFEHARRTAATL